MYDDLRPELSIYNRQHMITPNFERLANRSVIFDNAYAQIAVCNPSRDSLLTGLRPDTVGTYGFQSSFRPHITLQHRLVQAGYNTAGIGKILHWETGDKKIWSFESFQNDWYKYQNDENNQMNSSVMPDKVWSEDKFRDHIFTTKAIQSLNKLTKQSKPFMLAIGFKLPHLALHIPHKYFEMYKNKSDSWKLTKKELRFPQSSPEVSYRCCAWPYFSSMNKEGSQKSAIRIPLGNINNPFTEQMHDELMMGYCGAVSYLDTQLGRLLDAVDGLKLWDRLTIVLTSDHGMHNGEKGIWEKWSLFDESTRVPLLISHPLSPLLGKHVTQPVELLDIFPTVLDLLGVAVPDDCPSDLLCRPPQGKSLAAAVLGPAAWTEHQLLQRKKKGKKRAANAINVLHLFYK